MSGALPKRIYPPLFNRYSAGESFDFHIDNAVRQPKGSPERVRTDVSATLFFSDPEDYDGGELVIQDTYGVHQVAGDFGLAVDHHRLAAGQCLEVDVGELAIQRQFKAIMHQPFTVHALAHAGFAQQVHHALFQHPGADAPLHVIGALAFNNQGLDTGVMQQLAEQQSGGASANNGDLGFQGFHYSYRLLIPLEQIE